VYAGGYADASNEVVRIDGVVPIICGDDQGDDDASVLVRTEQREILWGAHLHCDRSQRVYDRGTQCHQGQRWGQLGAKNLFFALAARHLDAGKPRIRS
jgi:hypothetical protein